MAMQTAATLIPGVVNHRIGRVAGDGGLERIVRTFHARFGSVKMGGAMTARDRLAYVFREGKHKSGAADVESSAGDKEALLRDADRIKASARVRRGPTAERILATQIVELPAESTPEQRKACAEAFVADWKARGHEAVAVVHMHGEEGPQPHLHVEVAARAVDADGGVDRSTALWTGPHGRQAVQAERRRNADLVNRTCDPDPPYHPGNFRDIGIERPAKKRIPPRPFREARTRSREERADLRPTIDEARALGHERRVNRLETALANGAAQMYAVSAEKRAPLHEAHEQHRGKIEAAKAVGAWPPPPLRERLKQLGAIEREAVKKEVGLLEKQRDEAAAAAAKREKELKNAAIAIAARAGEELEARERQRKSAEWRAGELKTQRDAANNRATAAEASVATLTDEKQQAGDRARELEARQVQPLALTEKQRPMLEDVCARHGIEGDIGNDAQAQLRAFAALHEERDAWYHYYEKREAGEKRRAEERDEQRARAEAAEASAAALTAEKQQAETRADRAEGRVRELEAGTASGTEAAAVREAQPVPDAVPKPLDLPAAWTLPVGELIKAGDVVARKAAAKWGVADSSPTAMPLDGIDGVPVLTFTPVRGLLRKKPASWRYEDAGRYAGEAAIELEQPGFTDRNLDSPNWTAAAEALSRALVTDALEDGAETPRWLEERFPDLDAEYGPKIRTRKYPGENPRTYVGEMSGGKPHGAGTMTWKSGDRYEGAFENGHRHGQGVYDYPNGNRYEGAWQEGERHGQGVYTSADGSRYKGSWKAGKQHGAGVVISPEGEITEGVWEDGKRVEAAAKKTQTRYLGPEL